MRDVQEQGGFTLIEIIMGIILIPLLWFAIYTSLAANTMLINRAKHKAQAVFIAQQNIDILRSNGYSNLAAVTGQAVTIDTRATASTADDLTGTMNVALGLPGSPPHYRQVTVTINWNERMAGGPDKALTESLATIISNDPAG